MKKRKSTFHYFIVPVFIVACIIVYSFKTSEKHVSKEKYLEGIYSTEQMPSDIGEPHRIYFKFKKDGIVFSLASSLDCDSINKIPETNYAEISTYSITKEKFLNFKFVNNRVNSNKYTITYIGTILNNKNIKLSSTTQYDGSKPYNRYFEITLCQ